MTTPIRTAILALVLAAALAQPARPAAAQAPDTLPSANAILLDGWLGTLSGGGITLEHRFAPLLAGRIGFVMLGTLDLEELDGSTVIGWPLTLAFIGGRGNGHLEAGAGLMLVSIEGEAGGGEEWDPVLPTGHVGYRFQRPGRGVIFRAGLNALHSGDDLFVSAALGFGWGF